MAIAEAGRVVAGETPSGEVTIAKNRVMTSERQNVEKCGYEYDYYENDDVYRCRTEYELVRVPATVFLVAGAATGSHSNVIGAFAQAAQLGVTGWRLYG